MPFSLLLRMFKILHYKTVQKHVQYSDRREIWQLTSKKFWLLKYLVTTIITALAKHLTSTLPLLIFATIFRGRGYSCSWWNPKLRVATDSPKVSPLRWGRAVWVQGQRGFSCTKQCFSRWLEIVLSLGGSGGAEGGRGAAVLHHVPSCCQVSTRELLLRRYW